MPFISKNYKTNPAAPFGQWVCTRVSGKAPYKVRPEDKLQKAPDFCGQCVSFVTRVCPDIPVRTSEWGKGVAVLGNDKIDPGTAIATFDDAGCYYGHAAIYVRQDKNAVFVVDQWVSGDGKSIGERPLYAKHKKPPKPQNDPTKYFIVEPK